MDDENCAPEFLVVFPHDGQSVAKVISVDNGHKEELIDAGAMFFFYDK